MWENVKEAKLRHWIAVKGYSLRYFVAVNAEGWKERNVALIDVEGPGGRETELTLEVETVGELLQWIWAGLKSVEEVLKESKNREIGPRELFMESDRSYL